MATFFTSDTHFGHAHQVRKGGRPFRDAAAMDAALIERWNDVVRPEDDVWHLGDFSCLQGERLEAVFRALNGRKHLVVGNHDDINPAVLDLPWAAPPEKHLLLTLGDEDVFLCHYPVVSWPRKRNGAIHLHGHMHGRLPGTRASLDVGVDAWDYSPVCLGEIRHRLRTQSVRREPMLLEA